MSAAIDHATAPLEYPVRTPGRRLLGFLPACPASWQGVWFAFGEQEVLRLEDPTPPASPPPDFELYILPLFQCAADGAIHIAYYADPLNWSPAALATLPGFRKATPTELGIQ